MEDELVIRTVELPSGELRVLQPKESAELPDDGPVDRCRWPPTGRCSGAADWELARELYRTQLGGLRVVELGCGLAIFQASPRRALVRGSAC